MSKQYDTISTGGASAYGQTISTIVIEANDQSNGVFSFLNHGPFVLREGHATDIQVCVVPIYMQQRY